MDFPAEPQFKIRLSPFRHGPAEQKIKNFLQLLAKLDRMIFIKLLRLLRP